MHITGIGRNIPKHPFTNILEVLQIFCMHKYTELTVFGLFLYNTFLSFPSPAAYGPSSIARILY